MGSAKNSTIQKPLIEHIRDVRKHLTWVVLFIALGGFLAYSINDKLLHLLQAPLGESLYYTSPTGGIAFLFKLCIVSGIVFALPVILFNIFRFLEPVLEHNQRKGVYKYVIWSFIMAYGGILFAYFLSLPSALRFLTGFGDGSIQSLINVNEYFNFALAYIAGFAVLFQLPLIVMFINRIKPLKPSKMMGAQRYIIVGSFIVAAILTPTPDPFNQAMMAAPMIVLYQVSILLVLIVNRRPEIVEAVDDIEETIERLLHSEIEIPHFTALEPVHHVQAQTTTSSTSMPDFSRYRSREAVMASQPAFRPRRPSMQRQAFSGIDTQRSMVGNDFC